MFCITVHLIVYVMSVVHLPLSIFLLQTCFLSGSLLMARLGVCAADVTVTLQLSREKHQGLFTIRLKISVMGVRL